MRSRRGSGEVYGDGHGVHEVGDDEGGGTAPARWTVLYL